MSVFPRLLLFCKPFNCVSCSFSTIILRYIRKSERKQSNCKIYGIVICHRLAFRNDWPFEWFGEKHLDGQISITDYFVVLPPKSLLKIITNDKYALLFIWNCISVFMDFSPSLSLSLWPSLAISRSLLSSRYMLRVLLFFVIFYSFYRKNGHFYFLLHQSSAYFMTTLSACKQMARGQMRPGDHVAARKKVTAATHKNSAPNASVRENVQCPSRPGSAKQIVSDAVRTVPSLWHGAIIEYSNWPAKLWLRLRRRRGPHSLAALRRPFGHLVLILHAQHPIHSHQLQLPLFWSLLSAVSSVCVCVAHETIYDRRIHNGTLFLIFFLVRSTAQSHLHLGEAFSSFFRNKVNIIAATTARLKEIRVALSDRGSCKPKPISQ